MGNRLKEESSPYLLQHAENPVDWYPWCEEAFEKAGREDKPVFLSIGYSTCHWCHVMAHESFEDQEAADVLNKYFVSIKVDREERPDIDSVYMAVCQAYTGNGGWPMSIFMTAQQKPFFAGTYFAPESRYGMVGFRDLLLMVADKWEHERAKLLDSAEEIVKALNKPVESNAGIEIQNALPDRAAEMFHQSFDAKNGGFGSAPKFPAGHNLIFLVLYMLLKKEKEASFLVRTTLDKMRRGGIYDHIGYGFSRYSTDDYFLVPHFEKMLYDNALLMIAYACAYKQSGERIFLDTAEQVAKYIFREMTGPDGEFYSAQDADSNGEEGKYYVWEYEEICRVLGKEKGEKFCCYFGITRQGNFEGFNIPNLLNGKRITDEFDEDIKVLYDYRKSRMKLHLDDKVLTAWNALMACAMLVLYRVTGKEQYLSAAKRAQEFMDQNLIEEEHVCTDTDDSGHIIYVSWRDRVHTVRGFLDEYAYETAAMIGLYEATGSTQCLRRAEKFCREAIWQFADEGGGFFLYGKKNSSLIARPKETYDGALPSGNSVMAYCLVRLSQLTQEPFFEEEARKQLAFLSAQASHYPSGHSMFLIALLMYDNPPQKITVVSTEKASQILPRLPLYADVKILEEETEEYRLLNGQTTYYVCKDYTCFPPSNEIPGA